MCGIVLFESFFKNGLTLDELIKWSIFGIFATLVNGVLDVRTRKRLRSFIQTLPRKPD